MATIGQPRRYLIVGNLAVVLRKRHATIRSMALRPRLSTGLLFSVSTLLKNHHVPEFNTMNEESVKCAQADNHLVSCSQLSPVRTCVISATLDGTALVSATWLPSTLRNTARARSWITFTLPTSIPRIAAVSFTLNSSRKRKIITWR